MTYRARDGIGALTTLLLGAAACSLVPLRPGLAAVVGVLAILRLALLVRQWGRRS